VINLKTAKALGLIISNQMQFSPTEWSNRPDCCNALRSLMAQSLTSLRRSEWSLLGGKADTANSDGWRGVAGDVVRLSPDVPGVPAQLDFGASYPPHDIW